MWLWALLPVVLTIWATAGIWIVYAMAVSNGSVNITEVFPYISTCGSYPPQSCIFGQVLNIGAMLVVWISAIRFQQIRDYGCHSHLNSTGLAMGFLCALGTSIVGNFQQSIQLETHLVGAFLAFFIGNVYFWIQTALTYKVNPRHGGCWMLLIRFILSIATTTLLLMNLYWAQLNFIKEIHRALQPREITNEPLLSTEPGKEASPLTTKSLQSLQIPVIAFFVKNMKSEAAICEWIVAMILFLMYGLFCVDFWHLEGHFFHVKKRRAVIPNEIQASTITLTM